MHTAVPLNFGSWKTKGGGELVAVTWRAALGVDCAVCFCLPPSLYFSLTRSPHALKPGAVEQRIVLTLRRTEK